LWRWHVYYEGESVNRSQSYIKHKTCDIRNWKITFISWHIFPEHRYICPIALPLRPNPQHRSLWLLSQPLPHPVAHHLRLSNVLEIISRHTCELLYTTNTFQGKKDISSWISFEISPFAHRKTRNRKLFFGRIHLKHGSHFDNWNQPLNMRMRVA
jgi:hypothetical protein